MSGLNEKYKHTKGFDQTKLAKGIADVLLKEPLAKHHTNSTPANLLRVTNRLGTDARVTDIRWMAYMLATITGESRVLVDVPVLDDKDAPKTNPKNKKPIISKQWQMYEPAHERGEGAGKKYFAAAKVHRFEDGRVQVTEQDGQRFMLSGSGAIVTGLRGYQNEATLKNNVGSSYLGPVSKDYEDAQGNPIAYYGRGLVQLTWWTGYLTTSLDMGRGFDFLLNPDLLMDFDVSYEVMVVGMTTGKGYANRKKLSQYLDDGKTNYTAARAIINGNDKAAMFAGIAERFETMLMDAKLK